MHLDEEQLQRHLHGELSGSAEGAAREHLNACAACRERLSRARREEDEVHTLLRNLDHAMPLVSPEILAARARRPRSEALRLAAGFALAILIAGGAYAIPGSPVHRWVAAAVGRLLRIPAGPPSPETPSPDRSGGGISVTPGSDLRIEFASAQSAGVARVTLTDEAELTVRASKGAATFSSDVGRLGIDNRGSTATFDIEIPRDAPRVEILVSGKTIYLKRGQEIRGEGVGEAGHSFVLPLN